MTDDKSTPAYVYRYTQARHVRSYLSSAKLGLPSPAKWDDRNDAHFVDLYRQHARAKAIYCCCLTSARETFHHWKIFADSGMDSELDDIGVRLTFRYDDLVAALGRQEVHVRSVDYLKMDELRTGVYSPSDLPFIKRVGFKDEREWRAICTVKDQRRVADGVMKIEVPISALSSVAISPFCPEENFVVIKSEIKKLVPGMRVEHSRLLNNETWKKYGAKIMGKIS